MKRLLSKLRDRLRDNPHRLRWIVSRLLHRSRLGRFLTMERAGIRYRFHPSAISMELWFDPQYESWDREIVTAFVRRDDTVVDVGANIGLVALESARAAGPRGRVVAYEPHPRIHRYLVSNIQLNGVTNVDARQVAIGSEAGAIRFTDGQADDMNAVSNSGGLLVPAATLDQDLADVEGPIGFLKVDVEGYELPVLRGASGTIARSRCLYVEVAEDHFRRFGYHVEDVLELMSDAGLELYRRSGQAWIRIAPERIQSGIFNVVGIRRSEGAGPPVGSLLSLDALAAID